MSVPADVLERLWNLWQACPLFCSLSLPVVERKNKTTAPVCRKLKTLGRQHQMEFLSGPRPTQGGKKKRSSIVFKPSGKDLVCTFSRPWEKASVPRAPVHVMMPCACRKLQGRSSIS